MFLFALKEVKLVKRQQKLKIKYFFFLSLTKMQQKTSVTKKLHISVHLEGFVSTLFCPLLMVQLL